MRRVLISGGLCLRAEGCAFAAEGCAFATCQMDKPFDFMKDGHLLARLSGAETLGQFTAYSTMQVTAEGRHRGYFDLARGELVHTPHARQLNGRRIQLPVRDGLLHSVLVGTRATGAKKKADVQQNLFCLSYVQKESHFISSITNPLGLYSSSTVDPYGGTRTDWLSDDLKGSDFLFVITSPQCTSPDEWIWKCSRSTDPGMDFYPPDERAHTHTLLRAGRTKDFQLIGPKEVGGNFLQEYIGVDVFSDGDKSFDLMMASLSNFPLPSVVTAVGQAKRAMVATKHSTSKRFRENEPEDEDEDEDEDAEEDED